jgi:hypothetical protein
MNVNIKLSLTDIERNTMYRNLFGGTSAKKVSRAQVSEFVQKKVREALVMDCTESVIDFSQIEDVMKESISLPPVRLTDEDIDELEPGEIEYMIEQNRLLTSRMNRLQHMIDTRGLKK